jgi:hypothetical protein
MTLQNCKEETHYVAQLEDRSFIYAIESIERVLTCKSKIRARQFSQHEADKLTRVIKCSLIEAKWERVDTQPRQRVK